jgi:hypothetical protein
VTIYTPGQMVFALVCAASNSGSQFAPALVTASRGADAVDAIAFLNGGGQGLSPRIFCSLAVAGSRAAALAVAGPCGQNQPILNASAV